MNALDQANHLRQWIAERHEAPSSAAQPKLLVVGSGKGGVGVSTLAVGLSLALARDGRRTVLVDADFEGGDAAELCGLEDCGGLADVLAGRRTVHEVLQPATSGLHVLPGTRGLPNLAECSAAAQQRLVRELRGLEAHADFVVLDVGSAVNRTVREFWQAADAVLVVTSGDPAALTGAYAAIKLLTASGREPKIYSIVNRGQSDAQADDVNMRIAHACRKFLGLEIATAGWLPDLEFPPHNDLPNLADWLSPTSLGGIALQRLAQVFTGERSGSTSPARPAVVERQPLRI